MQAATTTSVSAIQGIADTIGKVAEIAAAIASAVEEQSAATGEISANVTEAAASTQEVSANIQGLNEGVAQTSAASAELLQASGELAHQAGRRTPKPCVRGPLARQDAATVPGRVPVGSRGAVAGGPSAQRQANSSAYEGGPWGSPRAFNPIDRRPPPRPPFSDPAVRRPWPPRLATGDRGRASR